MGSESDNVGRSSVKCLDEGTIHIEDIWRLHRHLGPRVTHMVTSEHRRRGATLESWSFDKRLAVTLARTVNLPWDGLVPPCNPGTRQDVDRVEAQSQSPGRKSGN